MGWASGSQLAQELYDDIRESIKPRSRPVVAEQILRAFEIYDADDWDEGSQLWSDSTRPLTWPEEE